MSRGGVSSRITGTVQFTGPYTVVVAYTLSREGAIRNLSIQAFGNVSTGAVLLRTADGFINPEDLPQYDNPFWSLPVIDNGVQMPGRLMLDSTTGHIQVQKADGTVFGAVGAVGPGSSVHISWTV